jgi:hypothetical protein
MTLRSVFSVGLALSRARIFAMIGVVGMRVTLMF